MMGGVSSVMRASKMSEHYGRRAVFYQKLADQLELDIRTVSKVLDHLCQLASLNECSIDHFFSGDYQLTEDGRLSEKENMAQEFQPDVAQILDRVKAIAGLRNDAELARLLGMPRQSISTSRRRSSVPYSRILAWCFKEGISADFIFFGFECHQEIVDQHNVQKKAITIPISLEAIQRPDFRRFLPDSGGDRG